jgi:hypothetical protein
MAVTLQARRQPRRWPVWLVLLGGAALLVWALVVPPAPPSVGARLTAFEPERLATLEQEAWEAYYYRQWPRLFWLLLQIMRTQFGLSWAQAAYAAVLNTQAQLAFARQGDAGGEAEATMRRFYALVREPIGGAYDVDRVAAAEVRWWVIHRHRQEYPDSSALTQAIADLYAELYSVPAASVEEAAHGRVRAMELSDRWIAEGQQAGSPLLQQVRAELLTGYRDLKAALTNPAP